MKTLEGQLSDSSSKYSCARIKTIMLILATKRSRHACQEFDYYEQYDAYRNIFAAMG